MSTLQITCLYQPPPLPIPWMYIKSYSYKSSSPQYTYVCFSFSHCSREYSNQVSAHCIMINDNLTPISLPAKQILVHHMHTGWYSGSISLSVRQMLVHYMQINRLVTQANIATKVHIGMHVKEELIKSQLHTNIVTTI